MCIYTVYAVVFLYRYILDNIYLIRKSPQGKLDIQALMQ